MFTFGPPREQISVVVSREKTLKPREGEEWA